MGVHNVVTSGSVKLAGKCGSILALDGSRLVTLVSSVYTYVNVVVTLAYIFNVDKKIYKVIMYKYLCGAEPYLYVIDKFINVCS